MGYYFGRSGVYDDHLDATLSNQLDDGSLDLNTLCVALGSVGISGPTPKTMFDIPQ